MNRAAAWTHGIGRHLGLPVSSPDPNPGGET